MRTHSLRTGTTFGFLIAACLWIGGCQSNAGADRASGTGNADIGGDRGRSSNANVGMDGTGSGDRSMSLNGLH